MGCFGSIGTKGRRAATAGWAAGLLLAAQASAVEVRPKDIPSFTAACRSSASAAAPRMVGGHLVFNGLAGGQQLDPQVAVGGGVVFNAANTGVALYSKSGEWLAGGSPSCLNGEIDPKIFFDPIGKRFVYASMSFSAQARIAVSKTSDPRGGWWSYPVPVPGWVDGGAVGGNRKWIVYSYPSGSGQKLFLIDREQAMAGATVQTVEFPGRSDPGQPVFTYDADQENLYFVKLSGSSVQVNYITPAGELRTQAAVSHGLGLSYPRPFPQKGSASTCSAGDINAKNAVLRNGHIWTADAAATSAGGVARTTVRFYKIDLTGKVMQTGAVDDPTGAVYSGQATIAVNKADDLMLVFQQSGRNLFIGARMAWRTATDPSGALRPTVSLAEGQGVNTATAAWGDYSGASLDGDNEIDLWGINSVASSSGRGNSVIFRLGLSVVPVFPRAHPAADLAVRQSGGMLFLAGLGLGPASRLEFLGVDGSRQTARVLGEGMGRPGELAVPTAQLPRGPVFLRLLRAGGRSDSLRVWVRP